MHVQHIVTAQCSTKQRKQLSNNSNNETPQRSFERRQTSAAGTTTSNCVQRGTRVETIQQDILCGGMAKNLKYWCCHLLVYLLVIASPSKCQLLLDKSEKCKEWHPLQQFVVIRFQLTNRLNNNAEKKSYCQHSDYVLWEIFKSSRRFCCE